MKTLIIDFETTGLDIYSEDFSVLECSFIFTDNLRIIKTESFLLKQDKEFKKLDINDIEENLFDKDLVKTKEETKEYLNFLIRKSDVIVAWNGIAFDFKILKDYFKIDKTISIFLDPIFDIEEISNLTNKSLDYCSYLFKTDVRPAHRAIFDTLTTLEILKKINIKKAIEQKKEPKEKIICEMKFAEIEKREFVKSKNFKWDGKNWYIVLRQSLVDELIKEIEDNSIKFDRVILD